MPITPPPTAMGTPQSGSQCSRLIAKVAHATMAACMGQLALKPRPAIFSVINVVSMLCTTKGRFAGSRLLLHARALIHGLHDGIDTIIRRFPSLDHHDRLSKKWHRIQYVCDECESCIPQPNGYYGFATRAEKMGSLPSLIFPYRGDSGGDFGWPRPRPPDFPPRPYWSYSSSGSPISFGSYSVTTPALI